MVKTDKQRLDDVRLTLQRLQRITIEPANAPHSGERAASLPEPLAAGHKALSMGPIPRKSWIGIGAVCIAGIALWWLAAPGSHPANTPTTATNVAAGSSVRVSPQEAAAMTARAQKLIESGKVVIAREQLATMAMHSPETALVLARSYDPNFLRLISGADASADPKQAEHWYRIWRDIAAERGMVMETERLERIIKAMN